MRYFINFPQKAPNPCAAANRSGAPRLLLPATFAPYRLSPAQQPRRAGAVAELGVVKRLRTLAF
jgi:hypothetical protein